MAKYSSINIKLSNSQLHKFKSAANRNITQRCSVKKVFLEISQNSQENT